MPPDNWCVAAGRVEVDPGWRTRTAERRTDTLRPQRVLGGSFPY
ncbi:MAG: hypothetical protein AVDCRST_MAG01-01-4774 [uncultured Rubrobacteraceae bacterium]|uniref:Uncharacterized protein n=1 Tax=uncultured Rubrobacteraceae bacterium TaxID=349277 RepID=A0A6J4QWJ0_9ACTN|nr:MAG: hypothetical protein AVDCRST_MAG01-01-4774 [uncultured Rubrobacteraceae bacterium]